jgi:hypothetical protein
MSVLDNLHVETLLKLVLVLVVVWIAIDIVSELVFDLLGPFRPLVGLVIVALIIVWWLD